ncbi:MAG: alpha/beta hydrolase-fold protein [bacterium]
MKRRHFQSLLCITLSLFCCLGSTRAGLQFEIKRTAEAYPKAFTGRVYVMLGSERDRNPKNGPNWFNPQPFFAIDVENWQSGGSVLLADGNNLLSFPGPIAKLRPGKYSAQAMMRINLDTHRLGNGPGNAFSDATTIEIKEDQAGGDQKVTLEINQVQPADNFPDNPRVKVETLESKLLSDFYGHKISQRAAVILPEGWDGKSPLPSLYVIPGFGGDHRQSLGMSGRMGFGSDFIRIVLDPDCGTGHHVFADSASNGPRGKALIEEFIPYLDKKYNINSNSGARFVNGHSSGGWSSLWLQVAYPETFSGVWSTSPDPIDFRDFQRINIYAAGENMFCDREGKQRPIARRGDTPVLFYENFSRMEDVMGPGGQLYSFEAVFSPLGPDKKPLKLWDRETGAIDLKTAETWKKYDIGLILEENWSTLGPKLAGKIHIIMGDLDTFYLEGATKLVGERLKKLKSDAVVEIVPGRDHGTILDRNLSQRIDREMKETLEKNGIKWKSAEKAAAKAAE